MGLFEYVWSLLRQGHASTRGDAKLEYALAAFGIALVVGYALWLGDGIRNNFRAVEAALNGADPVVTSSIKKRPQKHDSAISPPFLGNTETRGTIDTGTNP